MAKKSINQRDENIWYLIQILLEKGFKPNAAYTMISNVSDLSVRTIQEIRFSKKIPTLKEIELSNM